MAKKIGEYIQEKVRSRNLEDKDIAKTLGISVSAVRKIYPLDDLHISRIIQFCKILNEDIIQDFYYKQDPLRLFRKAADNQFQDRIKNIEKENEQLRKTVQLLEDHIETQKSLIETLKTARR